MTLDSWLDFGFPFQYRVNMFPWEISVQWWGSHSISIHQDALFEPYMLCAQTLNFCQHIHPEHRIWISPCHLLAHVLFHLLYLFLLFLFLSMNLPARTITLSLDKQHFIESDTAMILPSLRLARKTECCAQTYWKSELKERAIIIIWLPQHQPFLFLPCFYVVCLVLSSRKLDQILATRVTTTNSVHFSPKKSSGSHL